MTRYGDIARMINGMRTARGSTELHAAIYFPCAMVGRLMPCSPGSRVPSGLPRLANWMMLSARLGSHTPPRKLDRSNDGQDHTSIFWHSVKHAETNKRL